MVIWISLRFSSGQVLNSSGGRARRFSRGEREAHRGAQNDDILCGGLFVEGEEACFAWIETLDQRRRAETGNSRFRIQRATRS